MLLNIDARSSFMSFLCGTGGGVEGVAGDDFVRDRVEGGGGETGDTTLNYV